MQGCACNLCREVQCVIARCDDRGGVRSVGITEAVTSSNSTVSQTHAFTIGCVCVHASMVISIY